MSRETTIVFCADCSNIHLVRGIWSYFGTEILNSANNAARIVSTTTLSHCSTGPSHAHFWEKATFSFSPDHIEIAFLLGLPISSGSKERLWTLSKHLDKCRRMSCGFVPLERMSRRSAGATK